MISTKIKLKSNFKSERSGEVTDRLSIVKQNKDKKNKKGTGKLGKFPSRKHFSALRKKKLFKKLGIVALVFLTCMFLVTLSAGIYAFSYIQKINEELPSPDTPFKNPPVPSVIWDRNEINKSGTQLYKVIGNYNSDPVDINEIPASVTWSFLAAEDIDFYTHGGFDSIGIARCGFNYVKDRGATVCGGSTITQQLLKITALKDETNKYERKIKELLMSTKVEQSYEKNQILQMYLSVTPFGSNVVGIETASKFYFGVEPKDLTLAQSSALAAIIQNPSYLSPTKPIDGDKERAQADLKERQSYVLDQVTKYKDKINDQNRKNQNDMNASDIITDEMIQKARDEKLEFKNPIATDKKAGHFVDYVIQELLTKNYKNGEEPFTESDLQNNGYKIITSLDYPQQQYAEAAANFGGNSYDYWNVYNASVITIDPQNGEILAMAGSKDYFGDDQACNAAGGECKFNGQVNTLTSLNEPGSTAKVLAYTIAFEQGKLFGGSNIPDVPIGYPEINYNPKNWDGSYLGHVVAVRDALRQSRNITALQAIELITVDEYVKRAEQLGYTTFQRDQVGPSIVLGGASVRYTEHVDAFAAFANGGYHVPLNPILRIEDRNGNVVYQAGQPKKTQVLSPQSVFLTNQILDDLQGISGAVGVPMSSKTGTTEGNTEALQIAWNRNQVTLAWAGNNNNDPVNQTYGYPIYIVQPWLADYLKNISGAGYYAGRNPALEQPGFVSQGGGCNDKGECVGVISDWMIQGLTPPAYVIKSKAVVCKDQQDKLARDIDIATGNSMEKEISEFKMPASRFQSFLDEYLKSKGVTNGKPKENCTVDRSGGVTGPFFSSISVVDNTVVGNSFTLKGGIFTLSGSITQAQIFFDGQYVGDVSNVSAINQAVDISSLGLADGRYQFRIDATDTNGVTNSYAVTVILNSATNAGIVITTPPSPSSYSTSLTIQVSAPFPMTSATLYQSKNGGGFTSLGAMTSAPGGFQMVVGGSGIQNENASYKYYVVVTMGNTGTATSPQTGDVVINSV